MKKHLLLTVIALCTIGSLAAQDTTKVAKRKIVFGDGIYNRDSTWKFGGFAGATVSQVAMYQWGPGGSNSFAFLVVGNGYANYKKGKIIWDNSLDIKWGMVATGLIRKSALAKRSFQKNIDILALKSSFGYQITKSLYASLKVGFESQFSPSYDYSQTDTIDGRYRRLVISRFAAPAVLVIAPGITWKPKDYFTLAFSPVGGKMTFVTPDSPGRDTTTGTINGKPAFNDNYYRDVDETRFGLQRGNQFMGELGLELDVLFQKEIIKNVSWKSHLNVFAAYLNATYNTTLPTYYADNDSAGFITISDTKKYLPVVKWDNDIVLKINKFLSATLSARFVYQYNAIVPIDKRNNSTGADGADGSTDIDKAGTPVTSFNKLQIFEQFGVALSYKF